VPNKQPHHVPELCHRGAAGTTRMPHNLGAGAYLLVGPELLTALTFPAVITLQQSFPATWCVVWPVPDYHFDFPQSHSFAHTRETRLAP